jgi:hypothetical protein
MKSPNNKGIALVTALMLTLITLVVIIGVFSLLTQTIQMSAAQKRYRNALEASYGGVEIVTQEIIPKLFSDGKTDDLKDKFTSLAMSFGNSKCIDQKLKNTSSAWGDCTEINLNPKLKPDLTFRLSGNSGMNFNVFSKIVDTIPGVPYQPSPVGGPLLGGGVADPSAGTTMNLAHYVYRLEVAAERVTNPVEKSLLSVLYEF